MLFGLLLCGSSSQLCLWDCYYLFLKGELLGGLPLTYAGFSNRQFLFGSFYFYNEIRHHFIVSK
jgi:hypothetical protein